MFMRFRGGGVGHRALREANIQFEEWPDESDGEDESEDSHDRTADHSKPAEGLDNGDDDGDDNGDDYGYGTEPHGDENEEVPFLEGVDIVAPEDLEELAQGFDDELEYADF
jgi:hypothetical protein